MQGFAGKVAVVTGAGSGIGQALAVELARSGARVAISDVDTDGLAQTEERLKAIGAPIKADRLDVAERQAFVAYAEQVNDHFGKVNQIYNNAGIAFIGDIEISQFKEIERVMDIDFWGVVNGTKAFLPHLIASGDGHVSTSPARSACSRCPVRPPTTRRSSPFAASPRRCTKRWRGGAPGEGDHGFPRRCQNLVHPQHDRRRGTRCRRLGETLRQTVVDHLAAQSRTSHP